MNEIVHEEKNISLYNMNLHTEYNFAQEKKNQTQSLSLN